MGFGQPNTMPLQRRQLARKGSNLPMFGPDLEVRTKF